MTLPPLVATRGVGETAVVGDLPGVVVAAFGLFTYLGDPWLLMASLGLLYLVADAFDVDRNRVAAVLAVGFGALALTFALKTFFALPRPPGALEDGYGFPSGHALGSTAVWGAAAALFRAGERRRRVAVAGVAVALVATSRVVIGVHYLVDVVAGVAVGLGFLLVVLRVGPGVDPGPAGGVTTTHVDRLFSLALVVAVVGLAAGVTADGVFALGATTGAWVAWRAVGPTLSRQAVSSRVTTVLCLLVLPVLVGGLYATDLLVVALPLLFVGGGVLVGVLIVLPHLAARTVAVARS